MPTLPETSRALPAIAALGGATVLFEVLLTRIVAIELFANLAFAVLAVTLLGLGIGSAIAVRSVRRPHEISTALLIAAAAVLLAACASAFFDLVPAALHSTSGSIARSFVQRRRAFEADPSQLHWGRIALLVALQMIPFVAAGYAQALLLERAAARAGTFYAVDVAGATLGALVALPLLRMGGALHAMALVSVAFVLAAWLTRESPSRWLPRSCVAVVVAAAGVLLAPGLRMHHAAGFPEQDVVATDWSSLARVSLDDREHEGVAPSELRHPWLLVDNTSATEVAFRGDPRFADNPERIPFTLRSRGDVLILGAGGGQEIETALDTAAAPRRDRIDAVEIADGELRLMQRYFRGRPDYLLDQPGVSYQIADGRSFMDTSSRRWSVIQMKEVNLHTLAGQASTAWSANLLFTEEAFSSALEHLEDDGILAVTRGIYTKNPLDETLHFLATLRAAAVDHGLALAERLVIVDRPRQVGVQRMFMLARTPYTNAELLRIEMMQNALSLRVVRTPKRLAQDLDIETMIGQPNATTRLGAARGLDLSPTRDDMPFGHQHLRFGVAVLGGGTDGSNDAGFQRNDFRSLLLATAAFTFGTLCLLVFVVRRRTSVMRRVAVAQASTAMLLGAGFMLLEVVLIERVTLSLGHPTVAFVAVLTALLLALATGSLGSEWLRPETRFARASLVAFGCILVVLVLPLGVAWVAVLADGAHMFWRPVLVFVLVWSCAWPLGMLLPSMLRGTTSGGISPSACWAINGLASVAGSVLANLLVRSAGFAATGHVALAIYVVGALCWVAALPARRLV